MSLVHISYILKKKDESRAYIDVMSSDFSESGREVEKIGLLILDFDAGLFSFDPVESLVKSFCPPEYFKTFSGDADKVREKCSQDGFMCIAWSYRVYRKAENYLETRELGPENVRVW